MDATREKETLPFFSNNIQLLITALKGNLIRNFQRGSMLALTSAVSKCTASLPLTWKEISTIWNTWIPSWSFTSWMHSCKKTASTVTKWESHPWNLMVWCLPGMHWMIGGAYGVGRIIRGKKGKWMMISTYQSWGKMSLLGLFTVMERRNSPFQSSSCFSKDCTSCSVTVL